MDSTALFNLSYGVYVLSSKNGTRDTGCVVNAVTQISSSPATIAVSVNKNNFTNHCIIQSGLFAISILREKCNRNIIPIFGFSSGKDKNKFENIPHKIIQSGLAVLDRDSCAYIECRVINQVECFTHTVFIAEIVDAQNIQKQTPMTYNYYHKVIKGKAPKNAPTYIEPLKTEKPQHICGVCGYVYEGTDSEFIAEPDTYACPVCGVLKEKFS